MTPDTQPSPVSRRQRRRVRAAIALAVIAVVAVAIAAVVRADAQYGSLDFGSFGGYTTPDKFTGLDTMQPQVKVDGAQYMYSIVNRGSHSVRVTSIDRTLGVSDIQWTPFDWSTRVVDYSGPWRSFPATVPAHGTIKILFTLQRPARMCPPTGPNVDNSAASLLFGPAVTVHWRSLLFSHTSDISGNNSSIMLC